MRARKKFTELRDRCQQITDWGHGRLMRFCGGDEKLVDRIESSCESLLSNKEGLDLKELACLVNAAYARRAAYDRERRAQKGVIEFDETRDGNEEIVTNDGAPVIYECYDRLQKHLLTSAKWFSTPPQVRTLRLALRAKEFGFLRYAKICEGRTEANAGKKYRRGSVRAIAGLAFVLCHDCPADLDIMFSYSLADFVPYRPAVLQWFDSHVAYVRANHQRLDISLARLDVGFASLWERANKTFQDTYCQSSRPGHDYRMSLSALAMLMASRWLGSQLGREFKSSLVGWEKNGLLEDAQVKRQLAAIGDYCGEHSMHQDLLREERSLRYELTAAAMFMCGDRCGKLGMSPLVGSNSDSILKWVEAKKPKAFNGVVGYVDAFLVRAPYHNESTARMMLQWTKASMQFRNCISSEVIAKLVKTLTEDRTGWGGERFNLKEELGQTLKILEANA
ncbi:MAG: hypothetical protein K8U03_07785 [Planctomycetia bacterium]|nr:hypothetical protein [Planctomycetia bacterium]